jgi:plastocyanin
MKKGARSAIHAAHLSRHAAGVALGLFVGAAAVLSSAAVQAASAPVAVEIAKFTFAPKEITVAPGTTVVWTNQDETPHTVSAEDQSFTSKALDTGDRYEHTFDSEGDVKYFCTVHPFMTGVVHVRKP